MRNRHCVERVQGLGCVWFRKDAHAREFYVLLQNSYAIAQHLPACATDIAGWFACAVVGCKPTLQQLQRLFGARRPMVQALYNFRFSFVFFSMMCFLFYPRVEPTKTSIHQEYYHHDGKNINLLPSSSSFSSPVFPLYAPKS